MASTPTQPDSLGTAVAFALGILVGLLVAAPAFPAGVSLTVSGAELGPIETALLIAALSVLVLPLGVFVLYFLFVSLE
jgi:zinc transporter ZupT